MRVSLYLYVRLKVFESFNARLGHFTFSEPNKNRNRHRNSVRRQKSRRKKSLKIKRKTCELDEKQKKTNNVSRPLHTENALLCHSNF